MWDDVDQVICDQIIDKSKERHCFAPRKNMPYCTVSAAAPRETRNRVESLCERTAAEQTQFAERLIHPLIVDLSQPTFAIEPLVLTKDAALVGCG